MSNVDSFAVKSKKMQTIALFGGTGKTGKRFLKKALEMGYEVNALARSPEKISDLTSENLRVVKGDVLVPDDVQRTIAGADLVVSLFGHVKGSPDRLQTKGTKLIVTSMKNHGVDRILSLSGGGLPFPEKDEPKFPDKMIRFIMKIAVPKILNDAKEHARILKNSGLKWVIVRGPRLTEQPGTGNYRVGWVGVNASTQISRDDLADFLVTLVEDESYDYQMPFVSV